MNVLGIMKFMGECGAKYDLETFRLAYRYFSKMLRDGRIACIMKSKQNVAMIVFSVCNEPRPYYEKEIWDYIPQFNLGHIVYIEKLISKTWSKGVRTKFEEAITNLYPNLDTGIWHRSRKSGEQMITIERKLCKK